MHLRMHRAFSYIELLICTAIIGILYIIYFGPGSESAQSRKKAQCAQQLAQFHLVLSVYAVDHGGAFPLVAGARSSDVPLNELVPRYTSDTSVFTCPGSRDSRLPDAEPILGRRISYGYCMGITTAAGADCPLVTDALVEAAPKRAGDLLFSKTSKGAGSNHREFGGNVLFADGHVETFDSVAGQDWALPPGAVVLNPKD